MKTLISVMIDVQLKEKIDRLKKESGKTMAQIVREALEMYLDSKL